MFKRIAAIPIVAILALGLLGLSVSTKPVSMTGSWQVDTRHSDVQLVTDGTTDFGKNKVDFTLGFGRANGLIKIDDADPTKSSVVFRFYPATGQSPAIAENGKFLSQWLMNVSNQTLVCFHSKTVQKTPDGRLQATGDLTLTRVDRNVEIDPTEAYSGPTYGPPIIHRVSREATFVFDLRPADGNRKDNVIEATTSTNIGRENFPQLVKAVIGTTWPPLVKDENCQNPSGGTESYRGFQCTGTFMEPSGLPPDPNIQISEDYSGDPSNFNAIAGNHLSIMVHLRLMAQASAAPAAGGN
jgi:polyisoprenoid-binding protein YceI